VTEDGTASSVFRDVDFEVAGKTGSAQVPTGSDNAVCAAFAPVRTPEIAVVVIVEHGNSGNSIAPIARTVFEAYFNAKSDTGHLSGAMSPNN
ncbi:MAG: penicillin-binding protein 2, partial [Clostridia bacterium]|nr:penicillin-binding protein 2 [Clostridia bacterium]